MSDAMVQIRLTGDASDALAATVRSFMLSDELDVAVECDGVALRLDLNPQLLLQIASTVAGITSLVITLMRERRDSNNRQHWTATRLREAVATELLKHGVESCSIKSVSNFAALTEGSKRPCVVTAVDEKEQRLFSLCIIRDGTIYTFEVT